MLLLAEQGHTRKENGYKEYFILTFGTSDCEIVLALLEEVVILHISLILIHVQKPSLQRPSTRPSIWLKSGNRRSRRNKKFRLKNGPEDLLRLSFKYWAPVVQTRITIKIAAGVTIRAIARIEACDTVGILLL